MSNNSWQPAISLSWIAFIFSWCCSDAAFIQHALGKLMSQSSLQVLVVPVGVSGLKSSSSWRSEKSHCSSGKVSKSETKPKAWRNGTKACGLKRPCKKSYWNPESMLNEWAGSPGRETAQGEGTESEPAEVKHDFVSVQECLVRGAATEVISVVSAASCGPKAIVRGDYREGTGKRGRWVLRWIQGRVSFPTDELLTEELLHMKAEHVLVPLKRLSGKCATQPHSTKHLNGSRSICGPPLCVSRSETCFHITAYNCDGYLRLLRWEVWAFFSPFISLINSFCFRVPSDPSRKLLWVHDRNNKRINIHRMNPPTCW